MDFMEKIKLSLGFILYQKWRISLSILALFLSFFIFLLSSFISSMLPMIVEKNFEKLGKDVLLVLPFDSSLFNARVSAFIPKEGFDSKEIKEIVSLVKPTFYQPLYSETSEVVYKGQKYYLDVVGAENLISVFDLLNIKEGRWIREDGEVVLGYNVWDNLNAYVGDSLYINGKQYKIVGILDRIGSGLYPADNKVFVHSSSFDKDFYLGVALKVSDVDRAQSILEEFFDRKGKDVSIVSYGSLKEEADVLGGYALTFSFFVSFITFVVGLFNLINVLYMNVKDNYRIIGTMKALGTQKVDILLIFILGGMFVWAISFVLAVVFSYALSYLVSLHLGVGFDAFSVYVVGVVSFIFTLVSSYFPANEGANLSPVEALRYE